VPKVLSLNRIRAIFSRKFLPQTVKEILKLAIGHPWSKPFLGLSRKFKFLKNNAVSFHITDNKHFLALPDFPEKRTFSGTEMQGARHLHYKNRAGTPPPGIVESTNIYLNHPPDHEAFLFFNRNRSS